MKLKKYLCAFCVISLMAILLTVPAFAAGGDVAGAVEQTWDDAATQIKTVVDNVVFPALSMILAIAFFVKLGMSYFDYRTRGQFEWTGPAILFVCLITHSESRTSLQIRGGKDCWTNSMARNSHQTQRLWC